MSYLKLNSNTIGMLYKSYQLFWAPIVKDFRCKSLKMGQNLLTFQPNLVENCVNRHYILINNLCNDLNQDKFWKAER